MRRVTVANAQPSGEQPSRRTPGIVYSAITFALLGFACALPALVGLVLGLMARPQAKAAGTGLGLANAAVAVSIAWLVAFALFIVLGATGVLGR
jgi:hypothetical protein